MLNGIEKIEGLTPEQIEAVNQLAGGILSKNEELVGKLKSVKSDNQGSQSELERLRLLEQGLEQQRLEDKQNYTGALDLAKKQFQTDLEKLSNASVEKDQLIHKLLVENGLQSELSSLNVNPDLIDLIQAGFATKATVTDGKAMIGDKSLKDYVTEWASTAQGKAAILAPANSGGNANGGGGQSQGKSFAEMTLTEKTVLLNTDPNLYNQLKGT